MHNHIIKIKLLQVCIQCSAVPYCDLRPGVSILLRNSLTLKNLIVVVGYNLPECEINPMRGAQKFFGVLNGQRIMEIVRGVISEIGRN